MKIFCEYCGSAFNDTETNCPHCGAASSGVKRTASSQPKTIAELREWYTAHGLPPYETTRFFIGENHKGPRAFGIYEDEHGNFVVYKNKSDGSRAVRYEGTDEAYAVNELYQRLKEEIIQQKRAELTKANTPPNTGKPSNTTAPHYPYTGSSGYHQKKKSWIGRHPIFFVVLLAFIIPLVFSLVASLVITVYTFICPSPDVGYYQHRDTSYYCLSKNDALIGRSWFSYRNGSDWDDIEKADVPGELRRGRSARRWYKGSDWDKSLGVPDFLESDAYAAKILQWADEANNYKVGTGYYNYGGTTYYHATTYNDDDWYYWDDEYGDWYYSSEIPDTLQHNSLAQDFYYTPDWNSETQIYDFDDSDYADDYSYSSSYDDDSSWSSWDDDDDYDYDWDSGYDSWDSGYSDWDSDW